MDDNKVLTSAPEDYACSPTDDNAKTKAGSRDQCFI
jgi:hypothetical protein